MPNHPQSPVFTAHVKHQRGYRVFGTDAELDGEVSPIQVAPCWIGEVELRKVRLQAGPDSSQITERRVETFVFS